jgi:integrase
VKLEQASSGVVRDPGSSVLESLSEVRGKLVAGPTKTRTRRTVTLPRFVVEMIGEHIDRYPSDGHVFSSARSGPVRHHNFMKRHFYPAIEALAADPLTGFPPTVRFHDLRHTCAAILIGQGWSPKQITGPPRARVGPDDAR